MQRIMKLAIFRNCLLFLFMQSIVPTHNTVCYTCEASNNETCKHEEEKCPDGTSCMTVSEEYCERGNITHSILKRCARNLPCGFVYGQAGSDLYIKTYLKCCTGDRCNSGNFEMPKNHTKEKGVVCPVCYEFNTLDGCNATKSTVCWEEDDQCEKFRGTIRSPKGVQFNFSAQGCSSALACKYDYSEVASMKVVSFLQFDCYLPKDPPPQDEEKPPF